MSTNKRKWSETLTKNKSQKLTKNSNASSDEVPKKKEKKQKISKKEKIEEKEEILNEENVQKENDKEENNEIHEEKKQEKQDKAILFIGNLPFATTKEQIAKHFQCVADNIVDIRIITKKDTKKPKGCAFLELNSKNAQLTALKLHHTYMDERQINVELSGGGGGNSVARRNKIKRKNNKLHKQRKSHFSHVVVKKKEERQKVEKKE